MNPKISIIIPVYKVEKYLDKCVKSVIDQTYKNLEIILVDDGSPDNCPQICDEWAENDSRIRVIHKENGGVGSARNTGLEYANGEYVIFVDSDDYIADYYCKNLIDIAIKAKADIVCCNFDEIMDDTVTLPKNKYCIEADREITDLNEILKDCTDNVFYTLVIWAKIYRKEILKGITFNTQMKFAEDTLFANMALWKANKVCLSKEKGYFYYRNSESVTVKNISATRYFNQCVSRREIFLKCLEEKVHCLPQAENFYAEALVAAFGALSLSNDNAEVNKYFKLGREYYKEFKKYVSKYKTSYKIKLFLYNNFFFILRIFRKIIN